jgi:hypothetical protein
MESPTLTQISLTQPNAGARNPYQNTIQAVGGILDNYDTDKMYPVYGFGAKVREAGL